LGKAWLRRKVSFADAWPARASLAARNYLKLSPPATGISGNGNLVSPTINPGKLIMKRSINQFMAVAILATSLNLGALAGTSPGEVDFGKLGEPDKGGKYIEINLGRNLISLAAKLVDKHQPEAAKLLRSVQLLRVNVVGLGDDNRADTEKRVRGIRTQLDKQGWERIVTVQEQSGEDVGIYIKVRADEALEGVVVTVLDAGKKEAVFVNIVGDIKPEQITALGEALNIDPLKKIGAAAKK
jgi:hypothetical protein